MRIVAAAASALAGVELDAFTAFYDRRSGQTHLLVEPAQQILVALAEPRTLAELEAVLAADFDLAGGSAALAARVGELIDAGLVSRA